MVKTSTYTTISMYPQFDNKMQLILNKISCWNYWKRSKSLSKNVAAFDYVDKTLLVLSVTRSGVSIILFVTVTGVLVEITSGGLGLTFSFSSRTAKKFF